MLRAADGCGQVYNLKLPSTVPRALLVCGSGAVHRLQVERLQAAHTSAEGQEQQSLLQGLTAAEQLLAELRLGIRAADLQLAAAEAESQHAWDTAEAAALEASKLEGLHGQAEAHQVAARELQQADGSVRVAQQVSEQPPLAMHVLRAFCVAQTWASSHTDQMCCQSNLRILPGGCRGW